MWVPAVSLLLPLWAFALGALTWWFMPQTGNVFEFEGTGYEYIRWATLRGDNNRTMNSYLDMMVVLIGNRSAMIAVLGAIAQWKDGEQLRFWAAFWLLVIHATL